MEHGVISRLVCFARRYLAAFHNVNLSWEYLPQVPYQSLCIMEPSFMTTVYTGTIVHE